MIFKFNGDGVLTAKFWLKGVIFLGLISPVLAKPELQIDRPKNESMTVYESEIIFKGLAKNASKLTINGLEIPLGNQGEFDYKVELNSKNGNNYFLIEATDGADSIQESRTIFYDEKNRSKGKKETPLSPTQNKPRNLEKVIQSKMESNLKKDLSQDEALETLRNYIGKNSRGSYAFSEISLKDYIKIFAKEHQVNIINNVSSDIPLSVELNDMHPADVFNNLVNYWGCHWIMKDKIIRIVQQAPIRIYKLNYLRGNEFISLVTGLSNITQFKTNPIDNSIIAQGPLEDLEYLETLMEQLDVKPKQVLIEATIIETNFDLSTIVGVKPSEIKQTSAVSSSPFNLKTFGYTLSASYFENNSNVNILANPQILVTNHNTASIDTGNESGYTTTTVTETSTIENMNFLSTGITLEITPHISDNNEILMELNPSISEGQINNNKPISSKTSTKTQVIIRDGETIVIGGLIQKKKTKIKSKIPFLSDIPVVKFFFSQEEVAEKKTELSVLITPHIIDDSSEINYSKALKK
jgi:type II secretory pathway component GspD/PulD (secretin)